MKSKRVDVTRGRVSRAIDLARPLHGGSAPMQGSEAQQRTQNIRIGGV
ncbi:MAG: hypothetical protein AAF658_17655 [Myxococcota bacterium]